MHSENLSWKRSPAQPVPEEKTGGSRKIYQPVADRIDDQFSGLVDSESVHHVGAMNRDRVGAKLKLCGNFFIGFSVYDQLQDFQLAGRESIVALAFQSG